MTVKVRTLVKAKIRTSRYTDSERACSTLYQSVFLARVGEKSVDMLYSVWHTLRRIYLIISYPIISEARNEIGKKM